MSKFVLQQDYVSNQIYFNSSVFNIRLCKIATQWQFIKVQIIYFTKNTQNLDQQVNPRQNTVSLEQQTYASPDAWDI